MGDSDKKLGWLYIEDERDKEYQVEPLLSGTNLPDIDYKYYWPNGWWGNQGNTSHCVAYSWAHWLAGGPVFQPAVDKYGKPLDTTELYDRCQRCDPWPGEDYDGTSVRAGAKCLKEDGFVTNYFWTNDINSVIMTLLTIGPVVVGTRWHDDMFNPDNKGFMSPTGRSMGGHAYLIDGINMKEEFVRVKNSWGKEWGKNGFGYLRFRDFEDLIKEQADVCIAREYDLTTWRATYIPPTT